LATFCVRRVSRVACVTALYLRPEITGQSFCLKVRPRLVATLHTELHWLNVPERVAFKLGLMVFNCLHNQAHQYLIDLCQSVSSVASRQHLRCASRGLLVVPRHCLSSLWSAGFFCGRPCDMELVTSQSERSGHQQRLLQLQAFTEDVFIFSLLVYIAH